MYSAKIIADSINPCGDRLTTFELTYPRFVHAELMTHRLFSRNSASSRALPTTKLLEQIENDPVMPKFWGKNQSGMQAAEELEGSDLWQAEREWLAARDHAVDAAKRMHEIGMHKQLANRVLEPWMFITVIVSATEYENWFHLRDSEYAQPEIAWVAREMRKLYESNEPEPFSTCGWHLPYIELNDESSPLYVKLQGSAGEVLEKLKKISTARCARVSYLTHDGKRDYEKDIELHDKCRDNGHWSAFEHVAEAMCHSAMIGNFKGWCQYRKHFDNEHQGRAL
jgi:thymidylate synthase ThyX